MARTALVAVATALILAPVAVAKFDVTLGIEPAAAHVGRPITVVVRTGNVGHGPCSMRVVAVAPGANLQTALDALVNGGFGVLGPTGPTFHRLRPAPALGLRVDLRRTGAKTWRGTVRFPRAGRWTVVVPNWCAPGYAMPLPAARVVTVR